MNSPILSMSGVGKEFSGITVLNNIDFQVHAGEVVAVVGENGAGKSTLIKIIAGVHPAGSYRGNVEVHGSDKAYTSVAEAERDGVVLVSQELHVAPELSVAENMLMGRLPTRFGMVDRREAARLTRDFLDFFEMKVLPDTPMGKLAPSEQRMVTITAAMAKDAKLLLLDEPTASLTDGEAAHLFDRIRQITAQGVGVIYISHRLDELEELADRVYVMRNGEHTATFPTAKGRRPEIIRAMIGKDPETRPARASADEYSVAFQARKICVYDKHFPDRLRVDHVDLDLRVGEILGLFGLVGAGRTEFAKAIFGAWDGRATGEFSGLGLSDLPTTPAEAIRAGMAMLTEDRKQTGVVHGQSAMVNIGVPSLSQVSSYGFISNEDERVRSEQLFAALGVRPSRIDMNLEHFSGGNQQKVLLSRWLSTKPKLFIVDEPTYGVDIGARADIYKALREIADSGCSVLMISSDMNEIREECDRIAVMYKGKITAHLPIGTERHQLMAAATGVVKGS
ncbi:MAG: sugar ABC transporter ATP-binding protein [Hoeflea sp.]|uniref:sugar ABC transporter ATP-binding protein n=1 Tax=Hoeflea sp. TaxID=1940281 RepID=UPI00329943A2